MNATSPLQIAADPESINKWLADAILNSSLGQTLREMAQTKLGAWDFRQTVEATIGRMVNDAARDVVEKDPAMVAAIQSAVQAAMTPELIRTLAERAVARLDRGY